MASQKNLSTIFKAIDGHLETIAPDMFKSLRSPATPDQKRKLAALFGGQPPEDLEAWFSWHDGQDGDDFPPGPDPEAPAFTLLSIKGALAERQRLIDEPEKMLPWETRILSADGRGSVFAKA